MSIRQRILGIILGVLFGVISVVATFALAVWLCR
jgi:hypothetical protein